MLLPLARGFLETDMDPGRTGTAPAADTGAALSPAADTGAAFDTRIEDTDTDTRTLQTTDRRAETPHTHAEDSAHSLSSWCINPSSAQLRVPQKKVL